MLGASGADAHLGQGPAPTQEVQVGRSGELLSLTWADYEDKLRGTVTPALPRPGEPLKVMLHVGNIQGAPFDGPITLSLRAKDSTYGQSQTVRRGEVSWTAEFTPQDAGPHQLTVQFTTARPKVVRASFEVARAPVPRAVLWTLLGLVASVTLALGLKGALARARTPPEPAASPEAGPPPAS